MRTDVTFDHPNKMACGYYAARYMLKALGKPTWPEVPSSALEAVLHPTLPKKLMLLLGQHGLEANGTYFVTADHALNWLDVQLKVGVPVALFVKAKPLHWIVVLQADTVGNYYVYDPRVGAASRDPTLPAGNRKMTEKEIYAEWKGWAWYKYYAVSPDIFS